MNVSKIQHGQFFTVGNPFQGTLYKRWCSLLPSRKAVEPFAGDAGIVKKLRSFSFDLFDIDPKTPDTIYNDSINNFPKGYDVCITNPPYLAKNSAKRMGLDYNTDHDDLYLASLESALKGVKFLAAIIPASFLTNTLSSLKNRLLGVDIITTKIFDDTDVPVCVAYFIDKDVDTPRVYKDGRSLSDLVNTKLPKLNNVDVVFNSELGDLGLHAVDGTTGSRIRFCRASDITKKVSSSDRSITKIDIPYKVTGDLLEALNSALSDYREDSLDLQLTPFRGTQNNGEFRRRLSYSLARSIINSVDQRYFK